MMHSALPDLIGNTPMVRLDSVCDDAIGLQIFGKLESMNPGLSVKDRSARGLLDQARHDHNLQRGATIVESTSGNLGHALAMLCAIHGYRFICVLDLKSPASNVALVKAFGGEVHLVDKPDASGTFQKPRIEAARRIAREVPGCINLDQYNNPAAIDAHYRTTGPEILQQTGGKIDVLVGCASTGSHLSGTAQFLREQLPDLHVVGVEPVGSVVFGGTFKPFLQNGTGLSFQPGNIRPEVVNEVIHVSDADAFRMCRHLARNDGLLLGGSSGSVVHAALQHARGRPGPARNIVVILPDGGLKYLDTIYNDDWLERHGLSALVAPAGEAGTRQPQAAPLSAPDSRRT